MGTRLEKASGRIGERIAFEWQDRGTEAEQLRVAISQGTTPSNMALLSVWMVLWMGLGSDPSCTSGFRGPLMETPLWDTRFTLRFWGLLRLSNRQGFALAHSGKRGDHRGPKGHFRRHGFWDARSA